MKKVVAFITDIAIIIISDEELNMRIEDQDFQSFMFKVSMFTLLVGLSLVSLFGG